MFKLSERRGDADGPYCGTEGLFLGSSPLLLKIGPSYRVRAADEIAAILAAAYGSASGAVRLLPGLRLVAEALQQGDLARARIAALHLRLGEIAEDRLARTDALLKDNFDPSQPRVPAGNPDGGQWTDAGGGEAGSGTSADPVAAVNRAWERFLNPDFRDQLAIAEGSADKPNFGYTEVNRAATRSVGIK